MRALRCAAPHCLSYRRGPHLLTVAAQLEYEVELARGGCLCREALERIDTQSGEDGGSGGEDHPPGCQGLGVRPVGVPLTDVISWEASYMFI